MENPPSSTNIPMHFISKSGENLNRAHFDSHLSLCEHMPPGGRSHLVLADKLERMRKQKLLRRKEKKTRKVQILSMN